MAENISLNQINCYDIPRSHLSYSFQYGEEYSISKGYETDIEIKVSINWYFDQLKGAFQNVMEENPQLKHIVTSLGEYKKKKLFQGLKSFSQYILKKKTNYVNWSEPIDFSSLTQDQIQAQIKNPNIMGYTLQTESVPEETDLNFGQRLYVYNSGNDYQHPIQLYVFIECQFLKDGK